MVEHGFKKTFNDRCVFTKRNASADFIILFLYVDDMLVIIDDPMKIDAFKKVLSNSFAIKDLGWAKQIL